jgi:hypothetical protein
MITELVITDLTRMYRGAVCIAGYDKEKRCIRPVLPYPGIMEDTIIADGKPLVFKMAVVEIDLLDKVNSTPPHTEDVAFAPGSIRFVRKARDPERVLKWTLFDNVESVFEQPILKDVGFSVAECQGPRSIGTIIPKAIDNVSYGADIRGAWDYRIFFYDSQDEYYRLKITDLTWQYYCDHQRQNGQEPEAIAEELTRALKARKVYLRIGLSRGWAEHPDRCFLQVNGIYTFPDFLEGKTFLDYYSKRTGYHKVREAESAPYL